MPTPLTEFAKNRTPLAPSPKGWEPRVEHDDKEGVGVTKPKPLGQDPEEDAILAEFGLDPKQWYITNLRKSSWQSASGEWLEARRASFARRTDETPDEVRADIEAIIKDAFKRPAKMPPKVHGDDAIVFDMADWQIGKNTDHTVEGIKAAIEEFKGHVARLRKMGRVLDTLVLVGGGDIVENCDGHYPMQTFIVDLDRRGQNRVARRMISYAIRELAPFFAHVIVVAVPGNHGENRKDGKAFTTFADNDDVAVFEQVQEIFEGRPGFEHVEFYIADDEMSACIEVKGVYLAVAHGHTASRGGSLPQAKQLEWWKGQWWSDAPASKAQILLTHHYHHFSVITQGLRTHFQSPAFDGGSKWWGDQTGLNSPDGVLTFVLDASNPLGWDDVKIL